MSLNINIGNGVSIKTPIIVDGHTYGVVIEHNAECRHSVCWEHLPQLSQRGGAAYVAAYNAAAMRGIGNLQAHQLGELARTHAYDPSDTPRYIFTLLSSDPLTISPSIAGHCGLHGFIREGKWVPA